MQRRDLVDELLSLGSGDEQAAHVLTAAGIDQAIIGFHYQQATEKFLKALLAARGVDFPRTHDLVRLMELVEDEGYRLPESLSDLDVLTPFAVVHRYETSDEKLTPSWEHVRNQVETLRGIVEALIHLEP